MSINQSGAVLQGLVAIVTGGGAGIGGGISRALAMAGARVLLVDSNEQYARETEHVIIEDGGQAQVCVCDITEKSSIVLLKKAVASFSNGRVDILVNNVGDYHSAGLFCETDEENWEKLYNINLLHVFRCTHAFLPGMIEQSSGSIINLSSVEAYRGIPGNVVYAAFKGAVSQFTRSLAIEVGSQGVRVNAIAPDVTQSPQLPYDQWVPEEQQRMIPSWVPVGRFGTAEDHGNVAVFLASNQSSFITGHTIPVDGGTLASSGWFKKEGEMSWTNRPEKP
jgi:NAD(P)-dependent dehydrogenase (short-subunit alcohol dehydrogenase family)